MIYLDHNATTPLRAEVRTAVLAVGFRELFGKSFERARRRPACAPAVESARASVARLAGAACEEIVFTSGGTEGDNLAIRGLASAAAAAGAATS